MKLKNFYTLFFALLIIPHMLCGITFKDIGQLFEKKKIRQLLHPEKRPKEYERFFSPILFIPYRDQLRTSFTDTAFLQSGDDPYLADLRLFVSMTEEDLPAHSKSHREWHERWLKQLRKLIAAKSCKKNKEHRGSQLIDRICLWMYTEPQVLGAFNDILKLDAKLKFPEHPLLSHEVPLVLEKAWKQINKMHSLNGFRHMDLPDDPHLRGSLPTCQFKIEGTQFIYTARIAHEDEKKELSIYPEFLCYLDALEAQGKNHLYINLMHRKENREKQLSQKIETLEKSKKAFHAITLDHNSDFYRQASEFASLDDASTFKTAFYQHLFASSEKSLYHWSKRLDIFTWKSSCQKIIDRIHEEYFYNQKSLNTLERRAFIDIAYISFIRSLIQSHAIDYANISCKHCMDRGPQLTALLFADEMARSGSWSSENSKKFLGLVLAPPFISHNRPSLGRHIERISKTLPFIHRANKDGKRGIRTLDTL